MKRCIKCGETKPLAEYSRDKRYRDGHIGRCRACHSAQQRASRTPEKNRVYNLRARHKLDQAGMDYVDILMGDPCSYCGGPADSLDHIEPGGDRGWENLTAACGSCNAAKGKRSVLLTLAQRGGYFQEIPPGGHVTVHNGPTWRQDTGWDMAA